MKFKINKIKKQSDTSDTCGFHAMKFIQERINGHEFKEASGYDDSKKGEKDVEKFKKMNGFGYI